MLTIQSLDELARTMPFILESDLMNFAGGGGTTMKFNNRQELENYLNSVINCSCKEVTYVFYYDGKCAAYIDDKNTPYKSYLTLKESSSGYYYFPSEGASAVKEWGHTHPSGDPNASGTDNDDKNRYQGLPSSIYYNNGKYNYY